MNHGGNGTSTNICPMIMTFHGGHCEKVLWKSWVAQTLTQFTFSALFLFALAFGYEILKFYRVQHMRKLVREERLLAMQTKGENTNGGSCSSNLLQDGNELDWKKNITSNGHLVQSVLNLLQVSTAYFLMLVWMLFNYWMCLAVILGLALGYFCFGWISEEEPDFDDECCQ